jgi:hypothetical protein
MEKEKFDPRYLKSDPQKKHIGSPPRQRRIDGGQSRQAKPGDYTVGAHQYPKQCEFSSSDREAGQERAHRSDKDICHELCSKLSSDGTIDASNIEVEVTDGKVILTGEVASEYTKLAVDKLAKAIMDVKEVRNFLLIENLGFNNAGQSSSQKGIKKRLNP